MAQKKTPAPQSPTASATEIAKAAGKTVRWVQLQAKDGRFKRASHGQYDLLSVVAGLAALAEENAAAPQKSDARERVDQAKAKEAEMRIAERERELIPQEEALEAMTLLVGKVNDEFNGLAARCTRDIDERQVIEAEVDGSKTRIAGALGKLAGFVRTGGEAPNTF